MTDPKKESQASATGTTPGATVPATPPEDSQELSEAQLTSVTGGTMSAGSVAIDEYASTNLLEA
jgi:hypothetical protein